MPNHLDNLGARFLSVDARHWVFRCQSWGVMWVPGKVLDMSDQPVLRPFSGRRVSCRWGVCASIRSPPVAGLRLRDIGYTGSSSEPHHHSRLCRIGDLSTGTGTV